MLYFSQILSIQEQINSLGKTAQIGFVPTMGALHEGHLSLVERARKENDYVVVSIFVNPTQFDNKEDLIKYPKTLENDLKLLEKVNCDLVFIPEVGEIYAENVVSQHFEFGGLEHQMEGKFRKGHFDGVATIVKKLFEIVTPTNAYFGEKDFQQLQIIKALVKQEQLPITIVPCPIFREQDGLAMSSRNTRLTKEHRAVVPFIYKTLVEAKQKFCTETIKDVEKWVVAQFENQPLLEVEYFTIAEETTLLPAVTKEKGKKYRAFIAVFAGEIRLIDNMELGE
ncbi:MAG: pantoate--beta-alanine ligase [Flavobacteriaceae bacterium]|nr:pantoate--beta-alanine ligase [Flavobacteriaceae bacterium]